MSAPNSDSSPDNPHPWQRLRYVRLAVLGLVVVAGVFLLHGKIDVAAVHATAQQLDGGVAFALLVVLPLLGFPVSILHVAAGIRFGAARGLLLVSLSIGIQLLISYALVHRWRHRFEGHFASFRRRIPAGAHASVTIFSALIPGAPFAAINYVLPLLGIRFPTYLLCLWPVHTLRSTLTVLLGDQSDHFTPARLAVLGGYAGVLALGSWWLYRRLRRQLGDQSAAADGRTRPA